VTRHNGRTRTAGEASARAGLRSALRLPLFGDLADTVAVARLAAGPEEARWRGFFVGDHLSWRAPVRKVADPWITAAWSGRTVHHHRGAHYAIDGLRFLPRPVQQPGVPVRVAGFPGNARPLRRAARYDGFFPVNLKHPDQLAGITAAIVGSRRDTASPIDIVTALPPGGDPAPYTQGGRHLVAD
jgi:alkanesulfonate monooxygenase SsuD/methylene tetrahydromethanopterin reductase-like flavin-dependent oxidoreductase (luciferase family)